MPSTPLSIGPKIHKHNGDKCKWVAPQFTSKLAILGDSNLSRISHTPREIESIQIDSFPGAKVQHMTQVLSTLTTNSKTPDTLIINIGINNRDNKIQTHRQNLRALARTAAQKLPNTKIYIPQVNFAESLSVSQKQSLENYNQIVSALVGTHDNLCKIPPLNNNDFITDADKIHWTQETANAVLAHWTKNLN
jgi:hypothetical protein